LSTVEYPQLCAARVPKRVPSRAVRTLGGRSARAPPSAVAGWPRRPRPVKLKWDSKTAKPSERALINAAESARPPPTLHFPDGDRMTRSNGRAWSLQRPQARPESAAARRRTVHEPHIGHAQSAHRRLGVERRLLSCDTVVAGLRDAPRAHMHPNARRSAPRTAAARGQRLQCSRCCLVGLPADVRSYAQAHRSTVSQAVPIPSGVHGCGNRTDSRLG
jgi:hypothetical protein